MGRVYEVSGAARRDIAGISAYLRSHAGPATARSVLQRLRTTLLFVRRTPLAGPLRPELGEDVRMAVSQRWVVYYEVTAEVCRVLRVLDGARDAASLFGRGGPA